LPGKQEVFHKSRDGGFPFGSSFDFPFSPSLYGKRKDKASVAPAGKSDRFSFRMGHSSIEKTARYGIALQSEMMKTMQNFQLLEKDDKLVNFL
jgi:hypothetical protein